MSNITRNTCQGSAETPVKYQPKRCQASGDYGVSSVNRNTTRLGGAERTRTADFLLAKQVLYQLSYRPS
jgi:hypothetical protein